MRSILQIIFLALSLTHLLWYSITPTLASGDQDTLKAELTLSLNQETPDAQDAIETKTVGNFITIATSYLLIASTLIGVGMFTYASYQLFTSEGDSKKHGEALKGLMYTAIAFLVIFLSYTVVEVASRYSFS